MKLCSIASGSSGNCVYVGNDNIHLLVDAGISGKRIEAGLSEIDVSINDLSGIFITHEHSDHIQGLGVLARKYSIPIYGTVETIHAILRSGTAGKISEELFRYIHPDYFIEFDGLRVEPFSISHDASNPVCYTFTADGHKIGFATDLGKFDDYIIEKLSGSEILYLEANHDVNMLMVGGYPYCLKQRILGDRGHLSNDLSAQLICRLLHHNMKEILLAHLSKENNYAELAYETVYQEVLVHWKELGEPPRIVVAKRDNPSEMISLV